MDTSNNVTATVRTGFLLTATHGPVRANPLDNEVNSAPLTRGSKGNKGMSTLKKTAAVAISGLFISSAAMPTRFARGEHPALIDAQQPAGNADHSLLAILGSVLSESTKHQAKAPCKSPYLYSQHDVVGDPEACFMGQATFGGSTATSGVNVGR